MHNIITKGITRLLNKVELVWFGRFQEKFGQDLSFSVATAKFPNRNDLYAYMHHHFHNFSHPEVREHRIYYKRNRRSFGEDAFHAMWFALLREFRPMQCLEIGVYRGQVVSLWTLIARNLNFQCNVNGISPFTPAGDEVSTYIDNIDYLADTLSHYRHFGLREPDLIRGFSSDSEAVTHIRSRRWDLIYIDGNHDYEAVLADYKVCRDNLSDGGLLVMDDSSLFTEFQPPRFSFAGHLGPSRVVQEWAMKELRFLGGIGHNNIFIKN